MIAGTTAESITAVRRIVYCSRFIMLFVYPNNAEIEPNVSPVDISRVVYMFSFLVNLKISIVGHIPNGRFRRTHRRLGILYRGYELTVNETGEITSRASFPSEIR